METEVKHVSTVTKDVTVRKAEVYVAEVDKADVLKVDRIKANHGDTITWDVGNRIVSIWFPINVVFVSPVLAVKHRGSVTATIRDDAPEGVYEYAIYVHNEDGTGGEFVTCESHPKLEIPGP